MAAGQQQQQQQLSLVERVGVALERDGGGREYGYFFAVQWEAARDAEAFEALLRARDMAGLRAYIACRAQEQFPLLDITETQARIALLDEVGAHARRQAEAVSARVQMQAQGEMPMQNTMQQVQAEIDEAQAQFERERQRLAAQQREEQERVELEERMRRQEEPEPQTPRRTLPRPPTSYERNMASTLSLAHPDIPPAVPTYRPFSAGANVPLSSLRRLPNGGANYPDALTHTPARPSAAPATPPSSARRPPGGHSTLKFY